MLIIYPGAYYTRGNSTIMYMYNYYINIKRREIPIMKIKKISIMILILSLIFVGIAGCTTATPTPAPTPTPDPNATPAPSPAPGKQEVTYTTNGTVKTITYDANNNLVSFLVEGDKENNSSAYSFDKAIVTKTGVTKVYIGDSEEDIPANDLKEGMNVEIIYYGKISSSYPVKATARSIKIIENK